MDRLDAAARALVKYALGSFEDQRTDENGKWLNPPYTPNVRALEAAQDILAEADKAAESQKNVPEPNYWNPTDENTIKGPFIVWENYGYEGWQPKSYPTLKAALSAQRYNSEFVVTKAVDFDVIENDA